MSPRPAGTPLLLLDAGAWTELRHVRRTRDLRSRSGRGAASRPSFLRTLLDERLRIELGSRVVAALALENLELSTETRTDAVRRFILGRRSAEASPASPQT